MTVTAANNLLEQTRYARRSAVDDMRDSTSALKLIAATDGTVDLLVYEFHANAPISRPTLPSMKGDVKCHASLQR